MMEQERSNRMIADLDSVPPGYRFRPRDDELVLHYLKPKVYNEALHPNIIKEVQLYKYNPDTLIEEHPTKDRRVSEWYFFTSRDRKYRNGSRPSRTAGNGYWKATGADKPVKFGKTTVGYKKTLVFYIGKSPKGDKTPWIMHEFVLKDPPPRQRASDDDMRLDEWVLCRVYKKQRDIECQTQRQVEDDSIPNAIPDSIPDARTEIQRQECGDSRGKAVINDMLYDDWEKSRVDKKQKHSETVTVTPHEEAVYNEFPQAYSMPFNYDGYDVPTSAPLLSIPPQFCPNQWNCSMPQNYGNYMPTPAPLTPAPLTSIPPPQLCLPDQWGMMPQQQLFTPNDAYLLDIDFSNFGVPNELQDNRKGVK